MNKSRTIPLNSEWLFLGKKTSGPEIGFVRHEKDRKREKERISYVTY